jgi:DNA-binding CsgD family transcriptional regulator
VLATSSDRLRDDLVYLVHRGHDVRGFALAAARILTRAVPFDGVCVLTFDPATVLPTDEVIVDGLPPDVMPRMAEIEIGEADFNKFPSLARADTPAATLSEATEGELDRSVRHREIRAPAGFGDELRAALVSERAAWGGITLLRERGSPDFTDADARLVAALAPHLAEGLRRALGRRVLTATDPEAPGAVGLVLIDDENVISQVSETAAAWIDELQGRTEDGRARGVVAAVASRARRAVSGEAVPAASARVRTASGRWLRVHGSVLGGDPGPRTAVILEPIQPAEMAPLIADAYGLTDRERMITQLVAQGLSTDAISARLHLSAWTVQDHLKSVFEKTGVGTRGALVARLFFEHYVPWFKGATGQPPG